MQLGPDPRRRSALFAAAWGALALAGCAFVFGFSRPAGGGDQTAALGPYVVFGYNDLGMHCMQPDYSQMLVLPPFNTLHAQVIRRGAEPDIITGGITVRYTIPQNTHSADKCNWWQYAKPLLGVDLAPDMGLAGNGMSGTMAPTGHGDWNAVGIPVTPTDDTGKEDPYPLALITVLQNNTEIGRTQAVVPVSTEMSCILCHKTPGVSTATDILAAHDKLHGTTLIASQPVFCASCHADPAMGAPGQPGISTLSSAMHTAHAPRMKDVNLTNECYACHPGVRTKCQRDNHTAAGMDCNSCHTSMEAVGNPARTPWVDLPRCADCHQREEFEFEQPGKRYRDSVGHGGVQCMACHGSPHAITPSVMPVDNMQAINLQGFAGVIQECTVCHTVKPVEPFEHKFEP
jgi:hypothetical protein